MMLIFQGAFAVEASIVSSSAVDSLYEGAAGFSYFDKITRSPLPKFPIINASRLVSPTIN